jgi:hypothetical protein
MDLILSVNRVQMIRRGVGHARGLADFGDEKPGIVE